MQGEHFMQDKINLLDLNLDEMQQIFIEKGIEKFRAKQVFQWLHRGIRTFDEMTNLSKQLRERLQEWSYISNLKIESKLVSKLDGTAKYLFSLGHGDTINNVSQKNVIESVLMKYKHGNTVCITSQIGCKMGCKFCASTGIPFIRNLTPGEMLDQVISIQMDCGERVSNVVIMGIGEPLDNYENVIKFLRLLNHEEGLNIGYRHISLSTCGLVPEILKLAKEAMPITLSISLHAPNDEIRGSTMPINKKYSIDKLIEACKIYTETTKRRISFEYAVIAGVNDSPDNAAELARKIKGMLCHVNLIPVNAVEGTGYKQGDRYRIENFKNILEKFGIETTVRREMGADIQAACGQLRRSTL